MDEEALERAARKLHEIMERLDPTEDPDWEILKGYRKQFYRSCVKELIGSYDMISLFEWLNKAREQRIIDELHRLEPDFVGARADP